MKTIIIDGIEYNLTPKVLFKKGDFVVIQETTYLISKIEGLNVTLSCNGRDCLFDIDVLKNARLWDITKDAKDGDVLASKEGDDILIFRKIEDNVSFSSYYNIAKKVEHYWSKSRFIPATKEQREELEKAMADAGYTFDFEKRELKKIEQKAANRVEPKFRGGDSIQFKGFGHDRYTIKEVCGLSHYINTMGNRMDMSYTDANFEVIEDSDKVKPNPAWSEEDEHGFENCLYAIKETFKGVDNPHRVGTIDFLKSLKDRVQPQPKQEWSEKDEEMCQETIDWFKKKCFPYALEEENPARESIKWLKSLKDRVQPQNGYNPYKEVLKL